jgi:hypothetical protein
MRVRLLCSVLISTSLAGAIAAQELSTASPAAGQSADRSKRKGLPAEGLRADCSLLDR